MLTIHVKSTIRSIERRGNYTWEHLKNLKNREIVITMTNKIGSCDGCLSKNTCIFLADHDRRNIGECPCRVCLVKGICKKACIDYIIPWQKQGEPYKSSHLNKQWSGTFNRREK